MRVVASQGSIQGFASTRLGAVIGVMVCSQALYFLYFYFIF